MAESQQTLNSRQILDAPSSLIPIRSNPVWRELMLIHGAWVAKHLASIVARLPDLRAELERWKTELGGGKWPLDPKNEPPDARQPGLYTPPGGPQSAGTRMDPIQSVLRPSMDLRDHLQHAASGPSKQEPEVVTPLGGRSDPQTGSTGTVDHRSDGSVVRTNVRHDRDGTVHVMTWVYKSNGAVSYSRTTANPEGRTATVTIFRDGTRRDPSYAVRGDRGLAYRTAMTHERSGNAPHLHLARDPNPEALTRIPGFRAPGENPDLTPERSKVQADPGPGGAAPEPQAAQLKVPNLVTEPNTRVSQLSQADAKRIAKNVPRIKTPGANPGDPK